MITQDQIKRVHALVDKWGITDPIKQHTKMGEEIGEYFEFKYKSTLACSAVLSDKCIEEMSNEMGDMFFTLIAICKQLDFDFYESYWGHKNYSIDPMADNVDAYHYILTQHSKLGGQLLKNNSYEYLIGRIIRIWLEECLKENINESKALESVILKNEKKSGKTINGTFVKTI
jgi:hypothetical protein